MTIYDLTQMVICLLWAGNLWWVIRMRNKSRKDLNECTSLLATIKSYEADLPRLREIAAAIDYPDAWNPEAYPTLRSAIEEVAAIYKKGAAG